MNVADGQSTSLREADDATNHISGACKRYNGSSCRNPLSECEWALQSCASRQHICGGPKLLRCHGSQARVVVEVVDREKDKGSMMKKAWLAAVRPLKNRLSVVLMLVIGIVAG